MERFEEADLIEDMGPVIRLREVLPEPIRSFTFDPQDIYERFIGSYNRHRKGIVKLGGLGIGTLGLGFAAGAMVFHPRHA